MATSTFTSRLKQLLLNQNSILDPSQGAYKWFVLGNVMLGTFMAVLDATVVNVALPTIMASFGASISSIQWVITAYMLAMAAMLPISGWMADRFGYKRMFLTGIFLFTLGSALCGISGTEEFLILSRVVEGLGGGIIQALGLAIISRVFPPDKRGIAIGFWTISSAGSVSFGPFIGGYIVDNFHWEYIFYLNVPIGVFAIITTLLILEEYKESIKAKFDLVGFISIVIFMPLLIYALTEGNSSSNSEGWNAPSVLGAFAISTIALTVFISTELRVKNPILELRLLADKNFGLTNLIMFLFGMAMFGSLFLLPLYLQNAMNYSALEVGKIYIPLGIIQGFIGPASGLLSNKVSPRLLILVGMILLAFSFVLCSDLSLQTDKLYISLVMYFRGVGMGMLFAPLSALAFYTIPKPKMGQASGLLNTIRQLGGSFGVAIFSTIITAREAFHTERYGEALSKTSTIFQNTLQGLSSSFVTHAGSTVQTAQEQATALITENISTQAFIQSVNNNYYIAAGIMLLGLIPIIFLKGKPK